MKRTPESLFENIAQDNEVLQIFRHHSMRVMYLSSVLAKKIGVYDDDLRVEAFLHDINRSCQRNIVKIGQAQYD